MNKYEKTARRMAAEKLARPIAADYEKRRIKSMHLIAHAEAVVVNNATQLLVKIKDEIASLYAIGLHKLDGADLGLISALETVHGKIDGQILKLQPQPIVPQVPDATQTPATAEQASAEQAAAPSNVVEFPGKAEDEGA